MMLNKHVFYGVTFCLDDGNPLDCVVSRGYFDDVEIIKQYCLGGTVIDVGANAGYFALPLSRYAQRVVAIEPDYRALNKLRENINANPEINNIDIVCAAASSDSRLLEFVVSSVNPGNNSTNEANVTLPHDKRFIHTFVVDSLKLDNVNLMKIDVEGEEFNVLLGAIETIRRCRPVIYWEQNLGLPGNTVEQAKEFLLDLGYEHSYPGGNGGLCNVLSTPT